jgi:hypothetical protein
VGGLHSRIPAGRPAGRLFHAAIAIQLAELVQFLEQQFAEFFQLLQLFQFIG